ncbi:nSTAND1 domain-containing NTPase [Calothrix sp. NIES-2098]|uniref:nSTAND1 domain-containing NTPase n=1 Tax=Calothrix sp. NIES-2098 TaxID=1954171 RepID=UPI000B5E45E4|nr:WD-40 repeat-containing protein [Calothrix sp. NIES-2098]
MSHEESENIEVENERSLRTLVRAITLSQGEFSLIFLRCNYDALRQRIVKRIHELSPVQIREITLPKSVRTLYTAIKAELGDEQPPALMVFGLESVKDIDTVLTAANQVREEFRKNFPFPTLLWINDQVMQKMIRLAADLDNWATTIRFINPTNNLIEFLRQKTDEIFAGDVIPNRQICWELTTVRQDLQSRDRVLDPDLQDSLEFVLGLHDYLHDRIDSALEYYQQSLGFWQQSDRLERQGILLAHIALAYQRQASIDAVETQEYWQEARNYFQQAIVIFEEAQKPDLIAEYISKLGEVLRSLQAWSDLQSLAEQSLILHQDYGTPRQLAQDYGFLAEVALQRSHWDEAQQFAEQALEVLASWTEILNVIASNAKQSQPTHNETNQSPNVIASEAKQSPPTRNEATSPEIASLHFVPFAMTALRYLANVPNLQPYERSFYLFLLSRAQRVLGQVKAEISTLELAKSESNPQFDPKLYISILERLRELYFEQARYLDAFHLKQERLQIEQQYGFRAFVGASYLNPQRQAINPAQIQAENAETIAQEIAVSSRVQDVRRLRERVSSTEHKLTVIHGQSGVGKSSILQGGLIPALQQQPIGERDALPILLRSYTDWLGMLGRNLVESVERLRGISLHSQEDILEQLRNNERRNLLTVLIFDQFEEFFFVYKDQAQRRPFYEFLRVCLDIPFVKVILSLREDYLHYLLELDRLFDLKVINNNILDKNIRYYLGNFSLADAKTLVESLTARSQFYLEPGLIEQLVQDLAGELGEVRPIELQIVGTQLQTEKITTLEQYQQVGTKEKLVEGFLEEVITDCGAENKRVAQLVLYLLTDENGTRPLKTYAELAAELEPYVPTEVDKLDLVLEIVVKSGLVLLLPESPTDRYQLVHDYLVAFIRQQQGSELLPNQLANQFLAMSHGIRTPLSSIIGFTHLLLAQGYDPNRERHQEYLNIIQSSGKHLLKLINDILDISKIESNQLEMQWETVNVPALCNNVLALVKEKAANKGLKLLLDLDPNVTTIVADPLRLKQMLLNLLFNALKFTTIGTVGLKVFIKGIFVHFTVWDTGTGISKEDQTKLFQPYFQITQSADNHQEITALELVVTQKLAEVHGGCVQVESEVERGSSFTIILPLTPMGKQPGRQNHRHRLN